MGTVQRPTRRAACARPRRLARWGVAAVGFAFFARRSSPPTFSCTPGRRGSVLLPLLRGANIAREVLPFGTRRGLGSSGCFSLRRTPPRRRLAALGALPLAASAFQTYAHLLQTFPLVTKVLTSAFLFAVGDVIAQFKQSRQLDVGRLAKYALTGLGSGFFWAFYYDAVSDAVAPLAALPGAAIAASMVLEQFVWCPLLYGLYLIPLSTLLNGGALPEVPQEVRARLGSLLVANAKVWTPANLLIYSIPVEWRVGASNVVDLVWASICSDVAADCGADDADECSVSLAKLPAPGGPGG